MKALQCVAIAAACLAAACADPPASAPAGLFVSVQIPEALMPLERVARYEDPLAAELLKQGLGEITGGGTRFGPRGPDGKQDIVGVDLDVDLADAGRGLPALRAALRKLHAPAGTELVYDSGGETVKEPLWSDHPAPDER
jgi:hypothetical protein